MARIRLGVALLVPAPAAAEIDGLRRALGDGALDRMPPHLTLVPPVNVREDDLPDALALLRAAAAAAAGPISVTLGPVATFHPDNPVVFLSVAAGDPGDPGGAGDPCSAGDEVGALRARVLRPPLARPLTWPFCPHVTLADDLAPARIPAALAALADYRASVTFGHLHLLREGAGRVWAPAADVALGPPVVLARGGLPVELWRSERPDPDVATLLGDQPRSLSPPTGAVPFTVTARRDGVVLGVATGWGRDGETTLSGLVVTVAAGVTDVERHLRRVALDLAPGGVPGRGGVE